MGWAEDSESPADEAMRCTQAVTAAGKGRCSMAAFSVDMWSLGMLAYYIFEGYTLWHSLPLGFTA